MKTLLSAIAIYLFLSRCNASLPPNDCTRNDPIHELPWLRAIIRDTTYYYTRIDQATYRQQTVFKITRYVGIDAGTQTIYHGNGVTVCRGYLTIAGLRSDCKDVFNQLTSITILYQRQKKR